MVDGDTVILLRQGKKVRVRLIGINTPETVAPGRPVQCFGKEASDRAKELLVGSRVFVQGDDSQDRRDRYGRELDYIWLEDGRMLNELLVQEGFAFEYTFKKAYEYQSEFRAAQRQAKSGGAGLWSANTCKGKLSPVTG